MVCEPDHMLCEDNRRGANQAAGYAIFMAVSANFSTYSAIFLADYVEKLAGFTEIKK